AVLLRNNDRQSRPVMDGLIQVLQNLVNMLGIPSSLNLAVMGGVILIGVLIDQQWHAIRAKSRLVSDARQTETSL
ncbi:hypothetical protein ACC690_38255, partial [Rhizobium johnstonii]